MALQLSPVIASNGDGGGGGGVTPQGVFQTASTASIAPDVSTYGFIDITAQAGALTIDNFTGTPNNFQKLEIRIKDDGTGRALTFDTDYTSGGIALPTTTTASKTLRLGFEYNSNSTKFELIALVEET